jgi:thymidylate synthase
MKYRHEDGTPFTKEEFLEKLRTDKEFNDEFGSKGVDQISDLIKQLKENPDSRRLLLSAWNPSDLDQMVLPPCHYGFQVYTRKLSMEERLELWYQQNQNKTGKRGMWEIDYVESYEGHKKLNLFNIPTRAISLMWNQRSVDTFLGLPFNIASYGLLLEIIAKAVNMVPDELIGNLGDTHLYLNHVEQAKEQIGRELTDEERAKLMDEKLGVSERILPYLTAVLGKHKIPKRTREPYPLPTLNINTEFWPTESGECGEVPLDAIAVFNGFSNDHFCKCLLEEDLQLANYQSHPTIKAPLSN